MRFGAEWQPLERRAIARFTGAARECGEVDCIYSAARKFFGYENLYFVSGEEQLADLCGATMPLAPDGCSGVQIIDRGAGIVIGKFNPQS